MLSATRLRTGSRGVLQPRRLGYGSAASRRSFAMTTARRAQDGAAAAAAETLAPQTTGAPTGDTTSLQQAPNRAGVWTRNQQPREKAMTGPRFEQTDFSLQVRIKAPRAGFWKGHGEMREMRDC